MVSSNNIIELSSGHVFARGSVKSVSPYLSSGGGSYLAIHGIGFEVKIFRMQMPSIPRPANLPVNAIETYVDTYYEGIRQEYIKQLIG